MTRVYNVNQINGLHPDSLINFQSSISNSSGTNKQLIRQPPDLQVRSSLAVFPGKMHQSSMGEFSMKRSLTVLIAAAIIFGCAISTLGGDEPYEEGSVWGLSMVKSEANMADHYLKDLASLWNKIMAEAKSQGIILSYKVLIGEAANPDDWDILLMIEFENYAILDTIDDKLDAIMEKVAGTEEELTKANIERGKIREIYGGKMMREIIFK